MGLKLVGAILVIGTCGCCGVMMSARYRAEERWLRQVIQILEWIERELYCRMLPLPVLFSQVSAIADGQLQSILLDLSEELGCMSANDAYHCMTRVLDLHPELPSKTRKVMLDFGKSLGRYDLDGQIQEIVSIREEAIRILDEHCINRDSRLREYQTLGLCVGFGLAILLL